MHDLLFDEHVPVPSIEPDTDTAMNQDAWAFQNGVQPCIQTQLSSKCTLSREIEFTMANPATRNELSPQNITHFISDVGQTHFPDSDLFHLQVSDAELAKKISSLLSRQCTANVGLKRPNVWEREGIFFAWKKEKSFSVHHYILQIIEESNCERASFVLALVYLDRMRMQDKRLAVTESNLRRLFCCAVTAGIKIIDDDSFGNDFYAAMSGASSVNEFNSWEKAFLTTVQFRLCVAPDEYLRCLRNLQFELPFMKRKRSD